MREPVAIDFDEQEIEMGEGSPLEIRATLDEFGHETYDPLSTQYLVAYDDNTNSVVLIETAGAPTEH